MRSLDGSGLGSPILRVCVMKLGKEEEEGRGNVLCTN